MNSASKEVTNRLIWPVGTAHKHDFIRPQRQSIISTTMPAACPATEA